MQQITPNESYVRQFLAVERFKTLYQAFTGEARVEPLPRVSLPYVLVAIGVALLPPLGILVQSSSDRVDLPMTFMGTALVLALLIRSKTGLPFRSVKGWKESFSLTNTAFAIGCIPVPLILLFHSEALYVVSEHASMSSDSTESLTSMRLQAGAFILQVSLWAGLCEEFIYRGLLVSVIRRWNGMSNQRVLDIFAVVVSAGIFAIGHIPAWGPVMSVALFGLGIGFGVAYIAIGEAVIPVIIYHCCFDVLSLTFAYLTHKF